MDNDLHNTIACLPWQFDCQFGSPKCISRAKLNDKKIDCYSGFDEGCPAHFFVCRDRSHCIPPSKFLDGKPDCNDKSDEPCPQNQFQCANGSKCIDKSRFQDGKEDCSDGSDEECTASQFSCACGAVRCVSKSAISDGSWDCEDGSDELVNITSNSREQKCADGTLRRIGSNSLSIGTIQLCSAENPCKKELGQICIVIGGTWRCVCKLGTVRPLGSAKCVPVELLQRYMMNPITNCSELNEDLQLQFGTLKDLQIARIYSKKPSEIRRAPVRTISRTTLPDNSDVDGFLESGNERIPFMFNSDAIPDEVIDSYGTEPSFQLDEPQCDPNDKKSCDKGMSCQMQIDGVFRCACNQNSIFANGTCTELIDECAKNLHDCDRNAKCVDAAIGFECLCREGYLDTSIEPRQRPGRKCLKLVNECARATTNDCAPNAKCIDKPDGYTCRCQEGFIDISSGGARKPGRKCTKAINECAMRTDDCDKNAVCRDLPIGYSCRCPFGFTDISRDATKPGRKCAPAANPCHDYSLHDCDPLAECFSEQPGYFQCKCPKGFTDVSPDKRFPGRKCVRAVDECSLGRHTCDPHADCIDTSDGYTCKCRNGWHDASVDPLRSPGRVCKKADMCSNVDCAAEAECRETPIGPMCQCVSGYVDVSRQHGRPSGRVCRAVVNECAEGKHDCSPHASCIDTADGFTCRCFDNYRDESPDAFKKPGKICVPAVVPDPPECDVSDPMSCDTRKREVCLFVNNTYKCRCASGYSRLPDGRCVVINECQHPKLNTCGKNAECIDLAEGYTCQCRSGFADISPPGQPGRICRARVNECSNKEKYNVDCSENAICVDTDDAYTCQCRPGYADVSASFNKLPGRRCIEAINECSSRSLNDCSQNAFCEDAKEGYLCSCRPGYVDTSPNATHYPGRICTKPVEKISTTLQESSFSVDACDPRHPKCGPNEVCTDRNSRGQYSCDCADNAFRYTDGSCRVYSACSKKNDCDRNAICLNRFDSYTCQCRPGFIDLSDDLDNKPGRKCKELINECATADNECSPYAKCIDATNGYACQCLDGYMDVSSRYGKPPGRKCTSVSNECADKSLNTCDENADCIDQPDGYTCQCYAGFIDVSSNANLPPGRVCTVQTTCPKQKTDLVFLIDGSGSIGSYVFKNEVLRFVREFVELFEIGRDKTRVALIQYSDQIRHEFDMDQYTTKASLLRGITETQYLTGLTRTGAAIQHMVQEGFSERRGARPQNNDIARVTIVLTDGRSQDNVTGPAEAARKLNINTFAIGVTDHVLASELESIAGSPNRWFYVDKFKDLDTRLRSMIQKAACPSPIKQETAPDGVCNPRTQTGCDRTLNEHCAVENGRARCVCPEGFTRHPHTRVCGGDLCNPQLITSCIFPEECQITEYQNYRCTCPDGYNRDYRSGFCVSIKEVHIAPQHDADCHNGGVRCSTNEHCVNDGSAWYCQCLPGFERSRSGQCTYPGSCNPNDDSSCDVRKREHCLPHGNIYTCQCARNEKRHPITQICLKNECLTGEHDCDRSARCIDTDESYICACPSGFIDHSPNPIAKPGRVCIAEQNECLDGTHQCSPNALCTDTENGYVCRCKTGFVDYSPNPQTFPGRVCKELVNECQFAHLNTCSRNAHCIDTIESYSCICKPGYVDQDEFRNPGRTCEKVKTNDKCTIGKNDCDRNARCIQIGDDDYSCACPPGFKDKSPSPSRPGRLCIPVIPECDNPTLNDCDSPDRAICTDTDDGYMCRCRQGFLDISPMIQTKPGRLCKPLQNECALEIDDCARDGGICEDTPDAFTCRCAMNYLDVSFDRVNRPGRKCKRLLNECETGQNDCSPDAICTDTEDSYICACPQTHIDLSPDTVNRPGRRCLLRINECASNRHDCSPNADCVDTPDSYKCKCRDDFDDESPDKHRRPGRICRPALVDECRTGKHDCHRDAICQDLPQGYTCQCRLDFLDMSPHRASHPGRVCQPRPTPPPPECRLDGGNQCKVHLNEVCRLIGGEPKCSCPINYQRDSTGACTVINECLFAQLNDCHTAAECIDQVQGYTCRCRDGFKDVGDRSRPGRMCKPLVNECQFPHLNDCHQNARCIDLEEGYECKCHQGFMDHSHGRPGRICKQMINECGQPSLNMCDRNARCFDEEEGYRCECKEGFIDVSPSPTLKGRQCRQLVNECANPRLNDCDKNARCKDTMDSYECQCPVNSKDISPSPSFPGRVCLMFINECETGAHDCDPNAICRDNEQSFTCECPSGYLDRSPNKLSRPGRVCVKLVNECLEGRHTCSAQADCRDLEEGYTCECKDGYVDRSPNMASQPGRVCSAPEVCPSNHDCSSAAVCEPLGGMRYQCTCIQGYVDQSPSGQKGRVCVRNNACRDPTLNTCSRNAICYDEPRGYRCECKRGFIDRSPDSNQRGRVCEPIPPPTPPPRHPCQDPERNDCHPAGTCRATGAQSYTCECLAGYADKSPDPRNKPGRLCVLTEPVCLDPTQNDCHAAAICSEVDGPEKYTCMCRDGYIDESPDPLRRPGRLCREKVNECLDRSLNDCHSLATCQDLPNGYTCRCPITTKDQSPDPRKPGRLCVQRINECANPSLNSCSAFADCIDKENGYECRCRQGYHDDDPTHPGHRCSFMINECESANLNDCDKNAVCRDTPGGYECACKSPFRDEGPPGQPGRICRLNECLNPNMNNCDRNAECRDLDNGYTCVCRHGFYDQSPNPLEPGRVCIEFQMEPKIERVEVTTVQHQPVDGLLCGRDHCLISRGEVCISGEYCGCRPGEGRSSTTGKCQPVDETPFQIRVVTRDQRPLMYSSEYGSNKNAPYVEIVELFQKNMARTFGGTSFAPRYVNTKVDYITHPKTVNSSWDQGLLFKYEVQTTKSPNRPIDECELWKQMQSSLDRTNGAIGGGSLRVASDTELLNPCKQQEEWGDCGGMKCKEALGEVCIAGSICGCPDGMKRASSSDVCRVVESWNVPLWVVRDKEKPIVYSESFDNPQTPAYKTYSTRLEKGIEGCYPHTELKNAFVTAEVNDIMNPVLLNASYDTGLLFNTTVHFRKGMVRVPSDAYYQLVKYISDENNNEVGESDLYLNPTQPNPFKPCFKNDCDPHGKCIETSKYNYKCECGPGYRDMNPLQPGRKCLPVHGFNECERKEDNECSENARCIDLEHLYKCECLPSYYDASPAGSVPGSMCVLDYCSDVNFCPTNTTCKNMEQQAECKCDPGFMDIRKSEKRTMLGLGDDTLCMHVRDVDECALGLNNCSGVAHCIDRAVGYTCQCPDGYIDGNPDEPGRVCGALLCDLCNAHGDCVHNAATNNITCVCTDGWSGSACQVAPSNASLVLLILLALLFLLLTLCCLLYFCTKCHCFKGRGLAGANAFGYRRGGAWPWSTLEGSSSSESGAEFSAMSAAGNEYYPDIGIPRAKLKSGGVAHAVESREVARLDQYLDEGGVRIPRAHLAGGAHGGGHDSYDSMSEASSEYTIKEEIERKVTTDVTTKEIKTTKTTDAEGNTVVTTSETLIHPGDRTVVHGGASGFQQQMSGSSYAGAESTSYEHASSSASASAAQAKSSSFVNSGYATIRHGDERERGESIAEFSIGRARGPSEAHRFGQMSSSSSQNREMEEYTSEQEISQSDIEHEVGDVHTRVTKSHDFEPFTNGEAERFKTEMVKTKTSTTVNKY
ncbi:unnamed protein product [Caenorhabditis bovis]|uniref:Transmembrane cell adhesion receptor mua-3 n=1 Tax=Caenorhabditis bovis TaxID=2654633 RepID=A0A8S1ESU6_9PELO|nr:unnamed protein product [Caenorhabditis bovis]